MKIVGTHHVALRTANFAAMRAFYEETLGMQYLGGFPGRNIIFLDAGTSTVELIEDDDPGPVSKRHHLALDIEDIDAAHAELAAKGVVFHVPPRTVSEESPLVRLAFFRDPDGNEVELFQPIGRKYPQQ